MRESKREGTTPFLKWAGGKRWLAPSIAQLVGGSDRLVEPFVGGAAVFFASCPRRALLGDVNSELIATFRAVRDCPERIISELGKLRITHRCFDRIRDSRPVDDLSRAVRLIYLNRTAFNGLYRVNQRGQFNVPFGCKPGTRVCDEIAIRTTSRVLRSAELVCQDFRATLSKAKATDVIYVDPPYTVRHDANGFRRYNEKIFSWDDQQDLANILGELVRRGARVVVSNAHHKSVRAVYPNILFHAFGVTRATCMAGDPRRRGVCKEWLLISATFDETPSMIREILNGDRTPQKPR